VQNAFQFLFIHLSQNLGVATADIGLWAALLAGVEIPFFLLLDAIMPRVRMRTAYIVSALGMAAFLVLLGLVQTTPALALLLVFRGFTWPAIHLSSYTLVAEISHPHNVATNQAIMQVTMPAIALLLTGSFFGWIFDHLGAGAFFGLSALVCAIGATIVIAGFPAALVGILFTGALLIEVIFSLDGLGLLGFEAVLRRDYPIMFGTLFVFTFVGLAMTLVGDIVYTLVDPRIDFETRET